MALVFSQFILSPILAPNVSIVCHVLYSCQRVTKRRNVVCEVQVSQLLRDPLYSKTGIVLRFSHAKVDGDEEEKRGENATLTNIDLGISNVRSQTAAGVTVECLEYVDEFVRDPVKFQYFPE